MFEPERHPYFEPWTDPESGVISYILTERVAAVQQGFYFVNPSMSADGKWLWFYAAFPPAEEHTLGVVSTDADNPEIRHFPRAGFRAEAPLIDPNSKGCYFANRSTVYWQPVDCCEPTPVCSLDPDWIAGRYQDLMATHITLSTDGHTLLLNGRIGNHWWVGLGDTRTGKVEILKEFGRHYNHAQFSYHDPDLFSIAEDHWRDMTSGQQFPFEQRIWLMRTDGSVFEPFRGQDYFGHNSNVCHEFWSKDGWMCWADYERGAYEGTVEGREANCVWPRPVCHVHCTSQRRYWVADQTPYRWDEEPCQVLFYDRETGKEVAIASGLPSHYMPRRWYHTDPHPHFSPDDEWVIYTTTVRGTFDLAVARVSDLAERVR